MKRVLTFIVLAINLLGFLNPLSAYALSKEQKNVLDSGARYFNVEECGLTSNVGYIGNANEAEETVFWFFVSKGYTLEQAAGILGNMWVESGVNPRRVQGTSTPEGDSDTPTSVGYGLVQWTPGTKILPDAQKKGMSPGDLKFQIELLSDQLEGRSEIPEKAAGDDLKLQTTVRDAAISFMNNFERPKSRDPTDRVRLAERVYQNFSGKTPPAGVTITSSAGVSSCSSSNLAGTEQIIDGFVIYSQYDPAWRNKPYGTSTVGESGCGPSSVAMIASTWGDKVTPDQVAAKFSQYYIAGQGSSWALMTEGPKAYGFTSVDIGSSMAKAAEELRNGAVILASGEGPKPFTTGGHILVLRGITADGKILVGDSGHSDTSDKEWDPELLAGSIRNMWAVRR